MKHCVILSCLLGFCLSFANQLGLGINGGIAIGKLIVIEKAKDMVGIDWQRDAIYLLPSTPPEIKPVAGIITVGSGSLISHVQLLARSLGIPNAAINQTEFELLKKYANKEVVYVSYSNKKISVVEKSELSTSQSKILNLYLNRSQIAPVKIPLGDLATKDIIDLEDIDRKDSGVLSGPKAANLGTLKKLFPNRVADGIILPFGFVNYYFKKSGVKNLIAELDGLKSEEQIKQKLAQIRTQIMSIKLERQDLNEILDHAKNLISTNNGSGLFLRSDTNVEDLPQFTGAGLNKTVANILDLNKIEETIKTVWSSPWSERSHAWRVKFIKNPKDILPSVLIMQSVDAKKAGVFVHKNLKNDNSDDMFVSSNLGLGFKVVDGSETPEQWMLLSVGESTSVEDRLELENAALATTMYVLNNKEGGMKEVFLTQKQKVDQVLTYKELEQLDSIAGVVKKEFLDVAPVIECEFGVRANGEVVMFQVRPFVESVSIESRKLLLEYLSL